jgi:Questin oxidase-like
MTRTETIEVDLLDQVYERIHSTGPEFDGWLSNHGPMAADALARIGHADQVDAWLTDYRSRLDDRPARRWRLDPTEWPDALGDHRRLGDWTAYFEAEVEDRPWRNVLSIWWPRLLPGAVAAATHGLIRTGHAIRALTEHDTPARRAELAQGLGYWAARWQPLPAHQPPSGDTSVREALAAVSALGGNGGIRDRLTELAADERWPGQEAALAPLASAAEVPAALDALVDVTVAKYASWGQAAPVMLVHASTAPRAASLAITALPAELWIPTYNVTWAAVAALTALYRPAQAAHPRLAQSRLTTEDLSAAIAEQGDSHGLKFAEVAFESHARGNSLALTAVARAHEWLAE